MKIIPIGVDCRITTLLRDNRLRDCSLPFDWTVTYNGVSDIIKNDFNNYIPDNFLQWGKNKKCEVLFLHDEFPNDREKYERRINRLKHFLETTTDEILFFRKGHACHHHNESNCVINDIIDAENLEIIVKEKYPHLKYSILVSLMCSDCFEPEKIYHTESKNIQIHNITIHSKETHAYEEKFIEFFCSFRKAI